MIHKLGASAHDKAILAPVLRKSRTHLAKQAEHNPYAACLEAAKQQSATHYQRQRQQLEAHLAQRIHIVIDIDKHTGVGWFERVTGGSDVGWYGEWKRVQHVFQNAPGRGVDWNEDSGQRFKSNGDFDTGAKLPGSKEASKLLAVAN